MNKRMPPNRGPRPGPQLKSGPGEKSSKSSYYYPHRWCPPYYYDYDWYDYDYDWYDYYDNYSYTPQKRSKGAGSEWETEMDSTQEAYRQGFKDGWAAAMDVMYYSSQNTVEPVMPPAPMPQPPMPQPSMTEPSPVPK